MLSFAQRMWKVSRLPFCPSESLENQLYPSAPVATERAPTAERSRERHDYSIKATPKMRSHAKDMLSSSVPSSGGDMIM